MTVLHIANYYGGTEVYKNLFVALDNLGVIQIIYVPLHSKNHNRIGQQLIDFKTLGSQIIYSTVRKWYHRFLYRNKIAVVLCDICSKVDLSQISVMHASTLCFDGAVAYEIYKKYGIPYVVGISNTDVNVYYKKMFWERGFFAEILRKSRNVIFVSPSYQQLFMEKVIKPSLAKEIATQQVMIPFGLNDFFLDNMDHSVRELHTPVQLLYVGAFVKSKNLDNLITACDKLISEGIYLSLKFVGRGMSHRNEDPDYLAHLDKLASDRGWLTLEDKVTKEKLVELFRRNDIFVMPSFVETFGLVYGEALTQGCPIIYTRTQGFDNFFPQGHAGYGVYPQSVEDIAEKIKLVIDNYSSITEKISKIELENIFSWDKIGGQYYELLKQNSK